MSLYMYRYVCECIDFVWYRSQLTINKVNQMLNYDARKLGFWQNYKMGLYTNQPTPSIVACCEDWVIPPRYPPHTQRAVFNVAK